jgi:hypothetical protein
MIIKETGMNSSVITTHSYCSDDVISRIKNGVISDQLMKIGHWKSTNMFYNHYVVV